MLSCFTPDLRTFSPPLTTGTMNPSFSKKKKSPKQKLPRTCSGQHKSEAPGSHLQFVALLSLFTCFGLPHSVGYLVGFLVPPVQRIHDDTLSFSFIIFPDINLDFCFAALSLGNCLADRCICMFPVFCHQNLRCLLERVLSSPCAHQLLLAHSPRVSPCVHSFSPCPPMSSQPELDSTRRYEFYSLFPS